MLIEHTVLFRCGHAGVEREHLGVPRSGAVTDRPTQVVGHIVDLSLAGEEHEDVPVALPVQFVDGVGNSAHLVTVVVGVLAVRPVADVYGVGAAAHLDHWCATEVPGEPGGVERGRRDDELEVPSLRQQVRQVAKQEVDVQAPLVGLVHDDRVVAAQQTVSLDLGEQDAVGHHLHQRVRAHPVGEADGVAHRGAEGGAELVSDSFGNGACGHASRLGVANETLDTPAELEAQLG
ncbi:unannotated protein [freshwater metagenome]|uniref:Unannotated protein n=1 Tax=freshwater metagenome TaxID=449393 RepID=A0A6J6V4A4_9ZZZZ